MAPRSRPSGPPFGPDRLVYPNMGVTLADVVRYYEQAARYMVPHLRGHPVTLKRYPDDTTGPSFWEKNAPGFTPEWVATFGVWRRSGESQIRYILINDARTLAWAASVGTLEFHAFLAKAPSIEQPAAVVFDLDPGEGADILACCEVALLLRQLLARLELASFAKVSGVKGMQVYVPLNTPTTYAATQPFARATAELLHAEHPQLIVASMAKSERRGRVFIDWSQNADYKTTIAAYSLRAKRHRPHVSLPVSWDEIATALRTRDKKGLYFLLDAALERLDRIGDLFAPVLTVQQRLPEAFAVAPAGSAKAAPRKASKVSALRAAEQGGRRRFALHGNELQIEMHDRVFAWRLAKLPTRTPVTASEVERATFRAAGADDSGTCEVVEGSLRRGYLHLFFSGRKLKGHYAFARREGTAWQAARLGLPSAQREARSA